LAGLTPICLPSRRRRRVVTAAAAFCAKHDFTVVTVSADVVVSVRSSRKRSRSATDIAPQARSNNNINNIVKNNNITVLRILTTP